MNEPRDVLQSILRKHSSCERMLLYKMLRKRQQQQEQKQLTHESEKEASDNNDATKIDKEAQALYICKLRIKGVSIIYKLLYMKPSIGAIFVRAQNRQCKMHSHNTQHHSNANKNVSRN